MKDRSGRVIGFEKLHVSASGAEPWQVDLNEFPRNPSRPRTILPHDPKAPLRLRRRCGNQLGGALVGGGSMNTQ